MPPSLTDVPWCTMLIAVVILGTTRESSQVFMFQLTPLMVPRCFLLYKTGSCNSGIHHALFWHLVVAQGRRECVVALDVQDGLVDGGVHVAFVAWSLRALVARGHEGDRQAEAEKWDHQAVIPGKLHSRCRLSAYASRACPVLQDHFAVIGIRYCSFSFGHSILDEEQQILWLHNFKLWQNWISHILKCVLFKHTFLKCGKTEF